MHTPIGAIGADVGGGQGALAHVILLLIIPLFLYLYDTKYINL